MITYRDVEEKASKYSDIQGHLIRLYNITVKIPVRDKVVVELGVRKGSSTLAFIAAVNDSGGHLYSVDIRPCRGVQELYREEANFTFFLGDDMEVVKDWHKPIDHLFIDTSHTYEHTIAELREWGKWVKPKGIISLHDTSNVDVMRAINEFRNENLGKYYFMNFPECYGLGLLRRK